jgi:hypothetical protein
VARTNPIWVPVAAIRHSSPQAGAPGGEATTLAVADRPQAAEPAEGIKQALRAMPSSTKSPRQSRQPATTLTSTPRERPPWSSYRKPHRGWPDRPRRPARLTAGGPGDVAVAAEQAGAVHRLDRRHWHRRWAPGHDRPLAQLPYGAVTDLTVENRAGHRTLDASTPQWPSPRRVYRLQESTSPPAAPGERARPGRCAQARCSSRSPSDAAACWAGGGGPLGNRRVLATTQNLQSSGPPDLWSRHDA